MKKFLLSLLLITSLSALHAQNYYNGDNTAENTEAPKGFQKQNVFIGGSLALGFGSGSFNIGGNPEIGYSFAQWLDAGVSFNLNYNSQKLYSLSESGEYIYDGKSSSFNYGAGVFARVYPLRFLFVQIQPEINWIDYKSTDPYGNSFRQNVNAPSLIGGVGYSQRVITQGSYFLMIGLDLLNDRNSPYQDGYGHAEPIIRAGFDFYLHPSRQSRPAGREL